MNTRDHQNTQDTFTQAATHLQQAASSPEQIYQRAKDQVLDAADAVSTAVFSAFWMVSSLLSHTTTCTSQLAKAANAA